MSATDRNACAADHLQDALGLLHLIELSLYNVPNEDRDGIVAAIEAARDRIEAAMKLQ